MNTFSISRHFVVFVAQICHGPGSVLQTKNLLNRSSGWNFESMSILTLERFIQQRECTLKNNFRKFTAVKKVYVSGYFQAFLLSYNNATRMPIDFSLSKPFCLLFLELHRYELHYPVNYYKCFISLQSIDNLPLVLILVFCSQDMPSPFKDLSGSIFCFIQIAPFTSSRTHFSFSRSSDFTLWLWLHTFWKSVSPASLSVKTLQWSAHLLSSSSQWLRNVDFNTTCSPEASSELLYTNPFCSHEFQFVHNLEKILETIRSQSCGIVLTSIERHTS